MKIDKISVGVDFSEQSGVAVKHALDIARHRGAELALLHVGVVPDENGEFPDSVRGAIAAYNVILKEHLDADRVALEQMRERVSGQGVDVSHVVVDGFPDTGIVEGAAQLGSDLVVVGSHGRTGMKRFLLGSVAERVVRLSEVSVMVARGIAPRGGYKKILVPTDFSLNAEKALAFACELGAQGAHIDLGHCWQLPPLSGAYFAPIKAAEDAFMFVRQAIVKSAKEAGGTLIDKYDGDHFTLTLHLCEGSPGHTIQDWLEEGDYDLVVTGSHGRRGVRRFLLGSVAELIVRHAPCSVLVAHGSLDGTTSETS